MKTQSQDSRQHPIVSLTWQGQWIGGACLLALATFTWMPESYSRMVAWPWILIWQTGFLVLGIWGIWMLRQFQIPFRPLGYGLDWALGLVALSIILSGALAPFPEVAAWNMVIALCYGALIYILRNWLGHGGFTHQRIWLGVVLVGVITCLLSLAMWRPTLAMWVSDEFNDAIRNRLPFGNHNFVGGYQLLVLPLIGCFALAQKGWRQWLGLAATLMSTIYLYSSGSRGAMLGAVVVVLIGFVFAFWVSRGRQRRQVMIIGLVALIAMTLTVLSYPRVRNVIKIQPQNSNAEAVSVEFSDGPIVDRLFMLQSAGYILKTHPLLGIGVGNMSRVYNLYRPIEAGTGLEHVQQLHNTPAQLMGELGLLGVTAYIGLLASLARLWIRLYRKLINPGDRLLLYGIGSSLFAYSVSSLTDYQLENIGIASTIVLHMILLIGLADSCHSVDQLPDPKAIPKRTRRLLSLTGLAGLCLAIGIWLPVDLAMYFSYTANIAFANGNFVQADSKWTKAADLVPWDPVYPALAAQKMLKIKTLGGDNVDQDALTQQVIRYFEGAIATAPNDAWFNQNLGFLYLSSDPKQAEEYTRRAIQLMPRNFNHTYYQLAIAYLRQGKQDQAITALALEGLANPQFMTMNLWSAELFKPLQATVLEQTLKLYDTVLASTPNHTKYRWLYEQAELIRWWHRSPSPDLATEHLRPIIQALLKSDVSPEAALAILNTEIEAGASDRNLLLLRAWLDPDKYLENYLTEFQISGDDQKIVRQHISERRDVRDWLNSIFSSLSPRYRFGLIFAYRNIDANRANSMLRPDNLEASALADLLELFTRPPREYPQLDQLIERVRTEKLNLPHPTRSHFQLTRSPET